LDKPTEYQLEKFVLNPDSFSREERNWLMYWIEKDVVLNFFHSYFIDFYAKTKIISKSDPDQAVPKVNELEPYVIGKRWFRKFVKAALSITGTPLSGNNNKRF